MLTQDDKNEIHRLREEDPIVWTYRALAEKYGVSKTRIETILNPDYYERQKAARLRYYRKRRQEQSGR